MSYDGLVCYIIHNSILVDNDCRWRSDADLDIERGGSCVAIIEIFPGERREE